MLLAEMLKAIDILAETHKAIDILAEMLKAIDILAEKLKIWRRRKVVLPRTTSSTQSPSELLSELIICFRS